MLIFFFFAPKVVSPKFGETEKARKRAAFFYLYFYSLANVGAEQGSGHQRRYLTWWYWV
jgi:hypothetical protein